MGIKVTFLVSAFAQPRNLWVSLGSLIAQTDPLWEAIVLVNSQERLEEHFLIAARMRDPRIRVVCSSGPPSHLNVWDCYWSADWATANLHLGGEWICCASDDSYYCPEFVARMTSVGDDVDLVYCDLLYDGRYAGKRYVMDCAPREGQIDKTNFITRKRKWIGFPEKRTPSGGGTNNADGKAVEQMVRMGYKVEKVGECLAVHN